jgi:SAM-dependent methyltransferase
LDESNRAPADLAPHLALLWCPACHADLDLGVDALSCPSCRRRYPRIDGIPDLFVPNDWDPARPDVTRDMQAFYEESPFPDYDDFDSVATLMEKARQGLFAKQLDDELPAGICVLEAGCGTGQLSNFLSIANRTVFGTDMCRPSLELGEGFRRANGLERVHFLQMNLFRPAFRPETIDVVITNGVLHHTSDPFLAFQTLAGLVKPGGYMLVGLYHRYGRLITDLRRLIFRVSGERLRFLDPNLRDPTRAASKRRAWFRDQYQNPHESKHTLGEVLGWLERTGLSFIGSVPRSRPFRSREVAPGLFAPEPPGGPLDRLLVELGMLFQGSREGGFFVVIARRPEHR